MISRWHARLGVAVVLAGLMASVGPAAGSGSDLGTGGLQAAAASAPDLRYWLGTSRSLGLGLDLSRIEPSISSKLQTVSPVREPTVATRLVDPSLNFDALSFDLKVRWPLLASTGARSSLQPYFSLGPALFVARPDDLTVVGPPSDRRDVAMSVGVMGGAGLSWQLGENAALFSEYRFTQSGSDRLLPFGGKGWLGKDADTSDLLYGISVRF